jgi:hypothetical protein
LIPRRCRLIRILRLIPRRDRLGLMRVCDRLAGLSGMGLGDWLRLIRVLGLNRIGLNWWLRRVLLHHRLTWIDSAKRLRRVRMPDGLCGNRRS